MHPAAAAVLLGAGGIAMFAGANLAEAAENLNRPAEVPVPRLSTAEMNAIVSGAPAATETPVLLTISNSVGVSGKNISSDVTAVQQRLKDLGFDVKVDGKFGSGTARVIRMFESMLNGKENIAENSGRILPGSDVAKALASKDAPRWVQMPKSGVGFLNEDTDGFGWGSSVTKAVITDAGARYQADWLATHPGSPPIGINDVSKKGGGITRDHETHEAGLDIDIRLPRKDGLTGARVSWKTYDRDATEAVVRAFASDPRVERVIIGDWTLMKRIQESDAGWKSKVVVWSDHKDHVHVDVAGALSGPNTNPVVE